MGRRDLLFFEWSLMAAMSIMQSHAAHPVSCGGERRRRSAAEIRSIIRMTAPHAGQRHEMERGSHFADET